MLASNPGATGDRQENQWGLLACLVTDAASRGSGREGQSTQCLPLASVCRHEHVPCVPTLRHPFPHIPTRAQTHTQDADLYSTS